MLMYLCTATGHSGRHTFHLRQSTFLRGDFNLPLLSIDRVVGSVREQSITQPSSFVELASWIRCMGRLFQDMRRRSFSSSGCSELSSSHSQPCSGSTSPSTISPAASITVDPLPLSVKFMAGLTLKERPL